MKRTCLAAVVIFLMLAAGSCNAPDWVIPPCPVVVTNIEPANDALNVPVTKPVTITFNVGVDQGSLQNGLSVGWKDGKGAITPVDISLTMKNSNTTAEITGTVKTNQWGGLTWYKLVIKPGLYSSNGSCTMGQEFSSTFTTAQSN